MSGKLKVLENSFLYTLSAILVKGINFLLLPVFTLFLTPADYGIINLINGFNGVATFLVAFSLYQAAIRFYVDFKDDQEKLKRFFGSIITFTFISAVIFVIIGILLNQVLISWFFAGIPFYPYVLIGLLTLIFTSLHTMHQKIMKGMQQGKRLTVINLVLFAIQTGLYLLFIGVFRLGATGILAASLIIYICYVVFMMIDLTKKDLYTICLDKQILRTTLKYAIPLLPHNLSTHISNFVSIILINTYGILASVGLYSVAMQFGAIIDMIQSSVNTAFSPWFFDAMKTGNIDNKKELLQLSRFLLILYSLLYMVIGLFSQEAVIFMTTDNYIMAWTAIPILVVAFSVKSIYYFYINILYFYVEAAQKIFFASVTGSVADVVLSFLLVPRYGIYGAAFAFLIAKIILVAIVVIISRKYNDVGYNVRGMLGIIVPSLLFMAAGLFFSYTQFMTDFNWLNLLYKLGIFVAYLAFLLLTNLKMLNKMVKTGIIQKTVRKLIHLHEAKA